MASAALLADWQLNNIIGEMRTALDDLEAGAKISITTDGEKVTHRTPSVRQLMALARAASGDGFPRRSMGGGAPATVFDEAGDAMPPISDPTGELATADSPIADPIRHNVDSVIRGLTGALGDLRRARSSLIKASQHADVRPLEPGCSVHEVIGVFKEVFRDGRCRWCYKFWLAEKRDAPPELVRAHDQAIRITPAMVKAALMQPKHRKLKRTG